MIFGINTTSDISKLFSRAVGRVKFEAILKYHEWYLCEMSGKNLAIIIILFILLPAKDL